MMESLWNLGEVVVIVAAIMGVFALGFAALIILLLLIYAVGVTLDSIEIRRAVRRDMRLALGWALNMVIADAIRQGRMTSANAAWDAARELGVKVDDHGVDLEEAGAEPSPDGGYRMKRGEADP